MMTATMTQGVYLNIPRAELLEEFMGTRPQNIDLTEDDIMNEVRAVRYQ